MNERMMPTFELHFLYRLFDLLHCSTAPSTKLLVCLVGNCMFTVYTDGALLASIGESIGRCIDLHIRLVLIDG